jgi:hypothetical protein
MDGHVVKSIGGRVYRALFTVYGPAQVEEEPYVPRDADEEVPTTMRAALPPGYHVEWYVDEDGVRQIIGMPDEGARPAEPETSTHWSAKW